MNLFTGKPFTDRYTKLKSQRDGLPVTSYKDQFIENVKNHPVIIVMGETGSGKTTQLPQMLLHHFYDHGKSGKLLKIACTQPRRVAAMSVAKRVSEEMDVSLGEQVGYTIRFEDCTHPTKTLLKYMTDGMLLREAMFDENLSSYRAIVIDEAHERTVSTDLLMGLLKSLVVKRNQKGSDNPLTLVIMSATLDAEKFQQYYDNAPLLKIPGRTFPVEILYTAQPEADYLEAAVRTALQIHMYEDKGDILVFLTGEEEIETAVRRLQNEPISSSKPLVALPLYSSLPMNQQTKIFDTLPAGTRKIVFATNIAETSLTIDGIVYVIDTGFSKQKVYNPRIRVESLLVSPISQASADQRAGRAGRTCPGKCFRLYTEQSYDNDLLKETYPEILRCNLSALVLQMKRLGIQDLVHFDFIEPPTPEALMRALETLHYLGALDDEGELTESGYKLSDYPVDPLLGQCLFSSVKYSCSNEILTIVSMLSVPNMYLRPPDKKREADSHHDKFKHRDGDHLVLLNTYHAFKSIDPSQQQKWCKEYFLNYRHLKNVDHIREQLQRLMEKQGLALSSPPVFGNRDYYERILKSLLAGFFLQVAHLESSGTYATLKDNQLVKLHPGSMLDKMNDWVFYHEFTLTSHQYIRTVSRIPSVKWLVEVAPHYFTEKHVKSFPDCQGTKALLLFFGTHEKDKAKDKLKRKHNS